VDVSVRDASRILGVPEKQIFRWIDDGELPAYRVDEQYRFNRAELLEWATARKIATTADLFRATGTQGDALPGLLEALRAGEIFYEVKGQDKETVLHSVVEMLTLPPKVDREFLFRTLLAREALGSTGMGDGIAIPHVRNPIVLHVLVPSITLCFLAQPVDFGAVDGQPVHTLFSMISPTVRTHLHLLSRLAFALQRPEFKSVVARRAPRDEILEAAGRVDSELQSAAGGDGHGQERMKRP
jgi:PTS system nitrogen regulatory IIA component